MKGIWQSFWNWYERHYALNVGISAFLFMLQLAHLYWLTTDVVAARLFGSSFFNPGPIFETFILIVDYTEIPAIITTSLVYINGLRKQLNAKDALYLLFLNSQWLHIFWITDEFVVERIGGGSIAAVPVWLAWVAIGIDYLELPVIYDTIKKFFTHRAKKDHEYKK